MGISSDVLVDGWRFISNVIASEAKQSISPRKRKNGLLRSARNDVQTHVRDLAARCARSVDESFAQERAWGMPDARCTRGLVCTCIGRTHTSNNEYTGITRHSRTQWFYDLFRALPGDRACLPPSSADQVLSKPGWADLNSANLTPASGRQDHPTSPYATTSFVSSPFDRSQAR